MKTAIVGCGHIARSHCRVLRRLSGIDMVGMCDCDRTRAAELAGRFRVSGVFNAIDEMLEQTRPDALHLLTPPQTHRELAVKAMQAGCHVLVEKPMAMTVAEAEQMAAVAARTNVCLSVCHNFRFVPAFLKAMSLFDQGKLGVVQSVDVFWKTSYSPESRRGASHWIDALPGGIFHEVAPHLVSLAQAVAPDLSLSSCVLGGSNGRHDEMRALFDSKVGPVTLGISVQSTPVQKFVRIFGTHMSLHVDLATSVLCRLRGRSDGMVPRAMVNLEIAGQLGWGTIANATRACLGRLPRGHETLIRRFYEAIRTGQPPPSDPVEGIAVVSVLDQLWKAFDSESAPGAEQRN